MNVRCKCTRIKPVESRVQVKDPRSDRIGICLWVAADVDQKNIRDNDGSVKSPAPDGGETSLGSWREVTEIS